MARPVARQNTGKRRAGRSSKIRTIAIFGLRVYDAVPAQFERIPENFIDRHDINDLVRDIGRQEPGPRCKFQSPPQIDARRRMSIA